ncbi:MAG: formate acetyltransferase [Candidatus Schekmanbacteria bacterium]|nr:formate acetyltransferase [Candidatus Schekmanbacteria bacterium]
MTVTVSDRVRALDRDIRAAAPHLCAERALLVTRYFKTRADPHQPTVMQKAEALRFLLANKAVHIYPGELLVGCFTAHRVGGGLYPELHGVAVLEDLFAFETRPVNPLRLAPGDRYRLLAEVLPYWVTRFLAMRAFPLRRALAFVKDQLAPRFYLINETGGVSHFVPDYAGLLRHGTSGYRAMVARELASVAPGSAEESFLRSVLIACQALEEFAAGYARKAAELAGAETDPSRREELREIAATCRRVPAQPPETFREALQAILLAQIALNLESLDNAVSPGRLDQLLWPTYQREVAAGRLDAQAAFELLGCFALKLCEIVPAFSRRITRFHGGLFNGQVVVVGGQDRDGADATNELTMLFVELMDQLRTRQPNYHARLHPGSPRSYRARIAAALAAGAVSPALYNDDVIVPLVRSRGASLEDARDYATVGCVEPVASGNSFLSTDAALVNVPLCLELALHGGRQPRAWQRTGAATTAIAGCAAIADVIELLRQQLDFALHRLLDDLGAIERANGRWHPTPLTSMLLGGCIANHRDASSGGATYNGSGIQAVGVVDVADSLSALDHLVFRECRATLAEVASACRNNFAGAEKLRARLRAAPRYGNDDAAADGMVGRVMTLFADLLRARTSWRGGEYVAGFYSVTAHQAFGEVVGALPNGRGAGEPFSSGLSPQSGAERRGPTATLCSMAHLPLAVAKNGANFNLELAPWVGAEEQGAAWLGALIDGSFAEGGMQLQVNVLDPAVLIEARDHPGRYPGLLVRVSGYSAYFDDLSPKMKQEIIDRTMYGRPNALSRHS